MKKIQKKLFFTLFFIFIFEYIGPQTLEAKHLKPFPESHFTMIDSVLIHYRVWNASNPQPKGKVLLIHGFAGSTFCWRNNVDALLNAGYNVVAVDVPPYGYSSRKENVNHSTTANAKLLWELLDKLNNGSWIIAGHSMGAGIAGAMAAMNPSKTKKLILVDGPFFNIKKSEHKSIAGHILSSAPVKYLTEIMAKYYFYNCDKFQELLASGYSQEPDSAAVAGYLAPFRVKRSASAILELLRAREIQSLSVNDIKSPVLVIWGNKDTWIPIQAGKNFIQQHPSADFKVIEEAGHCCMETHPEEFNKLVLEFIDKLENKKL
jgi:pimeloyl-ACP methyl ester carboxylesterase